MCGTYDMVSLLCCACIACIPIFPVLRCLFSISPVRGTHACVLFSLLQGVSMTVLLRGIYIARSVLDWFVVAVVGQRLSGLACFITSRACDVAGVAFVFTCR